MADESNVVSLGRERFIKVVENATGITRENSNIEKALDDAEERGRLYDAHDARREKELEKTGISKKHCVNEVCKDNRDNMCMNPHGRPVSCMYRMITNPPNSLDYTDEYMPSHREALDMLEKHGLLEGDRQRYLEASVYYDKAKNYKDRNLTEIKGINFNVLEACSAKAIDEYLDYILTEGGIDLKEYISVEVLARNIDIEVEKAMGIYPNIKLR